MKTKIIYISGAEVFDMADIRSAFEEVRNALGLGNDTVMFGVPVDAQDAFNTDTYTPSVATTESQIATDTVLSDTTITDLPEIPATDTTIPEPVAEQINEPINNPAATVDEAEPAKKTRGRPKKATPQITDTTAPITAEETTDNTPAPVDTVVPILSVLAAQATVETADDTTDTDDIYVDQTLQTASDTFTETTEISDEMAETKPEIYDAQPDDNLDEIADNTAPAEPIEKTLEQLLESMAPLGEDSLDDIVATQPTDEYTNMEIPDDTTDTDATLAQLATEFAENQDNISGIPNSENRGKIGKLKNILPFKKARREDTGLMGDLFGWAGIAANDDDFSIPGFFANATPRK